MVIRSSSLSFFAVLFALVFFFPNVSNAGKNTKIGKVFRGQMLISAEPLPAPGGEDVKGTIKTYNAKTLKVIKGEVVDGVATWNFHFLAFLKTKPKTGNLVVEFYTDDKEKLYVADKRFDGVDPNGMVLAASVRISEDENLMRGQIHREARRKSRQKIGGSRDCEDLHRVIKHPMWLGGYHYDVTKCVQ